MFGDVLECTFFYLFGGSKVTVNKCPARNVTAPEHNNQFGVYKKFIFCKVTGNKQQHRYIGIHKKAIIIRVVNGLAFSMVTVFEDFSHLLYYTSREGLRHVAIRRMVLS
jgi:hypothetical protein